MSEESLTKEEAAMAEQVWIEAKKALGPMRVLSLDKETAFKMGFTMGQRIFKERFSSLLGRGGGAIVRKVVVNMSKKEKKQ